MKILLVVVAVVVGAIAVVAVQNAPDANRYRKMRKM